MFQLRVKSPKTKNPATLISSPMPVKERSEKSENESPQTKTVVSKPVKKLPSLTIKTNAIAASEEKKCEPAKFPSHNQRRMSVGCVQGVRKRLNLFVNTKRPAKINPRRHETTNEANLRLLQITSLKDEIASDNTSPNKL